MVWCSYWWGKNRSNLVITKAFFFLTFCCYSVVRGRKRGYLFYPYAHYPTPTEYGMKSSLKTKFNAYIEPKRWKQEVQFNPFDTSYFWTFQGSWIDPKTILPLSLSELDLIPVSEPKGQKTSPCKSGVIFFNDLLICRNEHHQPLVNQC